MIETLFSSAKSTKKREENSGLHASMTAHGLATCVGPAEANFAFLRALRG
jgi:hypothetical protein